MRIVVKSSIFMARNSISYPQPQDDQTVYSWTEAEKATLEKHIAKYPEKRSAVMPALWMAQEKWGWLPQGAIQLVADTLGMSFAQVWGVATFYTMYLKEHKAPNLLEVCTCFSCGECGGRELYAAARQKLNVNEDGVSADGKIYLREAECLGACDSATVVQINNRRLRYNVDEAQLEAIISQLREGETFDFQSVPLAKQ